VRLFADDESLFLDEIVALQPDHLLLAAPQRRALLNFPHFSGNQSTLNIEGKCKGEPDEDGRPFQFKAGFSVKSRNRPERPSLPVKLELAVPPILSVLSEDEVKLARDGDEWKLEHTDMPGVLARLDAGTGRLIKFSGKISPENDEQGETTKCEFSLRTEEGAWKREIESLQAKFTGAKEYDATAPWKSLAEFAADELIFAMRHQNLPAENIEAVDAARKLLCRWSVPKFADDESTNASGDVDDDAWFELPAEKVNWSFEKLTASPQSRKNGTPFVLRTYQRLVPRESWLAPAGRDVALYLASESQLPLDGLWTRVRSGDIGPLGCWLIGSFFKDWKPALARESLRDMTLEAFRKDYQPLLSGDGWLSKCLLSFADAARSLDEADLRAFASWIDDGIVREIAANWLLTLKDEPEKPVANGVSRMLDALWAIGLRSAVAANFKSLVPADPTSGEVRIAERTKDYAPTSATKTQGTAFDKKLPSFNDSPTAEALRGLDRFSEEQQTGDSAKRHKKGD